MYLKVVFKDKGHFPPDGYLVLNEARFGQIQLNRILILNFKTNPLKTLKFDLKVVFGSNKLKLFSYAYLMRGCRILKVARTAQFFCMHLFIFSLRKCQNSLKMTKFCDV